MRSVTYELAASLDAYIADPAGGVDWLFDDGNDYGLADFMTTIDTVIMGRTTYEFGLKQGMKGYEGVTNYVASTTLDPEEHPWVTVVSEGVSDLVAELREGDGKGIWLVGGGRLFRTLLSAGVVDRVSVAVHPILLGRGIPLLPEHPERTPLELEYVQEYETGLVRLAYRVLRGG